jgi:hypothetical protein
MSKITETKEYCEQHQHPYMDTVYRKDEILFCKICNKIVPCEFCDGDKPAVGIHLTYIHCKNHGGAAENCVWASTYPD